MCTGSYVQHSTPHVQCTYCMLIQQSKKKHFILYPKSPIYSIYFNSKCQQGLEINNAPPPMITNKTHLKNII